MFAEAAIVVQICIHIAFSFVSIKGLMFKLFKENLYRASPQGGEILIDQYSPMSCSPGGAISGIFINKTLLPQVSKYIENQESHHKKQTFREEYINLLNKAGIDYDPKYLFEWYDKEEDVVPKGLKVLYPD